MTLQELWMATIRRWKLVIALMLACVLACGGYLLITKQNVTTYRATAYIAANSQVAAVAGFASDKARELVNDDHGWLTPEEVKADPTLLSVSASANTNTITVTVTATSGDERKSMEAANEAAEYANSLALESYSNWENPYIGSVQPAIKAEEVVKESGEKKYLLVALLAGLFVGICLVVVLDMRKRPVKTPEGVQDAVELPVLEIMPAMSGERLLANVRFSARSVREERGEQVSGNEVKTVLVVPAGDAEAAKAACSLLEAASAAEGAGLSITQARPLSESMEGAYAARGVDAVVVSARQWKDALPQVESAVAELRLAGATLVGVVFAKEKLS